MSLFSHRSRVGVTSYNSLLKLFLTLLLVAALPVFIWAVATQRIELRKRAATGEQVVCWNKAVSGSGGLMWPNGCKGSPNPTGMCTQATVPLSAAEVYKYNAWVNQGKPIIPGCGGGIVNTIRWQTQNVSLTAANMSIDVNGMTFSGSRDLRTTMNLNSDPGNYNYTTLESTWFENGLEMRMYMYFSSDCTTSLPLRCTSWKLTEARVYNGRNPGDWFIFTPSDNSYAFSKAQAPWGQTLRLGTLEFSSSGGGVHSLTFTDLSLQPFISQTQVGPTPTPTPVTQCNSSNNGVACSRCKPCLPGVPCPIACIKEYGTCVNNQCDVTATPTPTPILSSCLNAKNGAACSLENCPTQPPCPIGQKCPIIARACVLQPGVCESGKCMLSTNTTPTPPPGCFYKAVQCIQAPCNPILVCPTSTPTPTQSNVCTGPNGSACTTSICPVCVSGQPCPMNACRIIQGTCQNGQCLGGVTPKPTCIPRLPCMDPPPGQPRCMPAVIEGGSYCPQTPTPTPGTLCKTGVNGFSVNTPCTGTTNTFTVASYVCYDGFKGTVGNGTTCQTSVSLANLAQQACAGRTSCTPRVDTLGDLNGDGIVNIFDYNILLLNFGKSGAPGTIKGDLNKDGIVNIFDYNIVLKYFK